jgi:hypothetical protein
MIRDQVEYRPDIFLENQQNWKQQRIKYLEKQLQQLKKAA